MFRAIIFNMLINRHYFSNGRRTTTASVRFLDTDSCRARPTQPECPQPTISAVAPLNVVSGFLVGRGSEHLFGQRVRDPSPHQHENALFADGVRATQFPEQHLPQRVFDDRVCCL